MAARMAEAMFETGRVYTKCGVMLEGLERMAAYQADLFAKPDPRSLALLSAIDGLNGRFGRNTMRLASEGFGTKSYDTKRAFKSVNRRPKRTPYRRAKGTPFVEQRDGYDGRTVRAGCGVGRA